MAFSHEKLIVYQRSIAFVAWANQLQDCLPSGSQAVRNHLDKASISVPLNIAEGNGKRSYADRARFLQIAQGSAVECAACLDVIVAQKLKTQADIDEGKQALEQIVNMLFKLIDHCQSDFLAEESALYGDNF